MTDPIADMLIRIKNASTVKHAAVIIPFSKVKLRIAEILKEEGYISDFQGKEYKKKKFIKIRLKYLKNSQPAISGVKRISKPGRHIYIDKNFPLSKILGIGIVSTPLGIMTIKEAKKKGQGGEFLGEVW